MFIDSFTVYDNMVSAEHAWARGQLAGRVLGSNSRQAGSRYRGFTQSTLLFDFFFFFESHSIVQAGLKFTAVLSQLPQELEVEPLTVSATS